MNWPITLVIPTHNRPGYLDRIIDYYSTCPFSVLILDSSAKQYQQPITGNYTYMHVPGKTFTQKLAYGFAQINTPFLAMCADDDFLIPGAIGTCIQFLESNNTYSAASGNIVCYIRNKENNAVAYAAMYTDNLEFKVAQDDPFKRLEAFFNPYRSMFYAVHRTASIRKGFAAAADVVTNLYLNEYLTAIVPIVSGKYKELPVFYQVREYAVISDDKTTLNIDSIIGSQQYKKEFDAYIETQSGVIALLTGKPQAACGRILYKVLADYALALPGIRDHVTTSSVKKMGNIIAKIPFFGKKIIWFHRARLARQNLKMVIKTRNDETNLGHVTACINRH